MTQTASSLLSLPPALKLMRPHHWIKSGFVAAPLFFTPSVVTWPTIGQVALGILAWSFVASAVYILNDWKDREADRLHPTKKNRPLAAGTVSSTMALILLVSLLLSSVVFSLFLGAGYALCLGLYFLINLAYSHSLKHIAIVDVMCIAMGFVLRVLAGAAIIAVAPSPWIIILTGLLALFLGFAKRRDDVVKALGNDHRKALDGYSRSFIDTVLAMTMGTSLVSYLIYTTDEQVMERLHSTHLYYTAPFVIFAMLRYLQITMVEERSGSPTLVVLTDKPILVAGMGWLLTFGGLIYK